VTIRIPLPVVVLGGAALTLLTAYVVYKEAPPLYRYLVKFEAM
jgi:hypothetical protein